MQQILDCLLRRGRNARRVDIACAVLRGSRSLLLTFDIRKNLLRADIRGHNDNRVLEVHGSAL